MKRHFLLSTVMILGLLLPAIGAAQTDLGFKGVGLMAGYVDPENVDATMGFGLIADLGTFTEQIALEANLNYWSQSEGMSGFGEASIRDIYLGGKTKYFFPVTNSSIRPFAGAGLSLHFVQAKASTEDIDLGGGFIIPGMSVSDSSTKLGLDLGGGVATSLSERTDVMGELWYGVVSDINQFSFRLGLLYKLGI